MSPQRIGGQQNVSIKGDSVNLPAVRVRATGLAPGDSWEVSDVSFWSGIAGPDCFPAAEVEYPISSGFGPANAFDDDSTNKFIGLEEDGEAWVGAIFPDLPADVTAFVNAFPCVEIREDVDSSYTDWTIEFRSGASMVWEQVTSYDVYRTLSCDNDYDGCVWTILRERTASPTDSAAPSFIPSESPTRVSSTKSTKAPKSASPTMAPTPRIADCEEDVWQWGNLNCKLSQEKTDGTVLQDRVDCSSFKPLVGEDGAFILDLEVEMCNNVVTVSEYGLELDYEYFFPNPNPANIELKTAECHPYTASYRQEFDVNSVCQIPEWKLDGFVSAYVFDAEIVGFQGYKSCSYSESLEYTWSAADLGCETSE